MKCPECRAKIKNGEEVCPECGKYITAEKSQTDVENEVHIISESKIKTYRYEKRIVLSALLRFIMGVLIFVFFFYYMATSPRARFASSAYSAVLVLLFGGFSIFSAVASIIQERNCYLCIDEEKVYGIIPKGTFETQKFEVPLNEIVYVEKADFNSRFSNPKIIIITAEQRTEIRGSSGYMLSEFCEELKNLTGK